MYAKVKTIATALLLVWGSASRAADADSVRTVALDQVTVNSSTATATTPVAYTHLSSEQLTSEYFVQDMPFLLSGTPSVIATSDAGNGTGYTYIRIRGTDATRINVTTNGVPMNDPESHSLYWVNTPDLASMMGSVQIQRGAGTSTNGAGAFGGSINMSTAGAGIEPYGEVTGVYGSFNTHRESVALGTGLINGKWALSGRVTNVGSDGYIDRASSSMQSYFAQVAYYGRTTSVKALSFGGKQKTYMAWNGLTAEEMAANRTYNSCGEIYNDDGTISYYPDQTDNYRQLNNQIIIEQLVGNHWKLNLTGHYTRGDGYYQEYKGSRTLSEYGLAPYTSGGATVTKSDLVRKKAMWNNFGGVVASANYVGEHLEAAIGGAWNLYSGDHFGRVLWVKNYIGPLSTEHEYYRNTSSKHDANIFAKVDWNVARGLNLYADIQYRIVRHRIAGANDNYDWNAGTMQQLDVDRTYHFINPKLGVYWQVDKSNQLYLSGAIVSKEPTRNCFTDARPGDNPKAENMLDIELGYKLDYGVVRGEANLYFMGYRNQLIQTGEINDIGEMMITNVPRSYRAGIELSVDYQPLRWFGVRAYTTLSRNRVLDYTEYLSDYDADWNDLYTQSSNHIDSAPLAFSPSALAGLVFKFSYRGFGASLNTQYVSKQYLSNSGREELTLPRYCVTNLNLAYSLPLRSLRSVDFGLMLGNLFNTKYVSNGYGSSMMVGGERYESAYYFPQAGFNVTGSISLKF
ncbi:MAG: TonB-dependent receptor [Rikenellaceae bacterium]|nr:TonB-dependent receptor [Rikenellaceae bacterium]